MPDLRQVRVGPLPRWLPADRLLGPGLALTDTPQGRLASGSLSATEAADLAARLRGLAFGGLPLQVDITPPLPRALVRAARTEDARRRRDTSPGFTQPGTRLDDEGRWSLTPEALALEIGRLAPPGATIVDAGCGAGGNSIGFARAGSRVHALELDASRLEMARHNARLYGVADRIRFERADARERLAALRADLLFVDPPWGTGWDRGGCGLADLPLLPELLPSARGFAEVWLKLPPSFDPGSLEPIGAVLEVRPLFGVATGDARRVKLLLVRLRGR